MDSKVLRFNKSNLEKWLTAGPVYRTMKKDNSLIKRLRQEYQTQFPAALADLQDLDKQFAPPRQKKGYSLSKVANKRIGFVYYVRYIENGYLVPSRWCTHTNNREIAEQFAQENRDSILTQYHERHKVPKHDMYAILTDYYAEGSEYLKTDMARGRKLAPKGIRDRHNFIIKKVLPFFKSVGVRYFDDITAPIVAQLQDHLLKNGNKPQSVNLRLSCLSTAFNNLRTHGIVFDNPFYKIDRIRASKGDKKVRGCYELDKVYGVFNKKWDNKTSYILCLLIYSTGMRNSEITRITPKHIIQIEDVHFIDIPASKSDNGVRIVPLHEFVYEQLVSYIKNKKVKDNNFIFTATRGGYGAKVFQVATSDMGKLLELTPEQMAEQNITFYSGRHYWKTVMSSAELGDVEEYFMGHKVSADVAKIYNHRDKLGQKKILAKAREALAVLDKQLFKPLTTGFY
ncbi:hypothetical protein FACS1894109_11190 [Spirochaetia bacterium]|nr:hypothetical protein FACS1894109_11190 [Spirochaetia bacterium]